MRPIPPRVQPDTQSPTGGHRPAKGDDSNQATLSSVDILHGLPIRQPDQYLIDSKADYEFLCGKLIDKATLRQADELARLSNTTIHSVLISHGWMEEDSYVAVLSRHLDIDVVEASRLDLSGAADNASPINTAALRGIPNVFAVRATAFAPRVLIGWLRADPSLRLRMRLVSSEQIEQAHVEHYYPRLVDQAVRGLQRFDRDLSAHRGSTLWQRLLLAVLVGLPIGSAIVDPSATLRLLSIILAVPFVCVVLLRGAALTALLLRSTGKPERTLDISDAELPTYSILVPLYKEAEVLPRLILSLSRLDYPTPKLDIMLVLESSDHETRAAVARESLPGCFRVVIVPPGEPRTKPRALNYALQLARGTYVVVFDAEDRPEPTQLRAAVARFARGGRQLACVQARLNTYNPIASLLTRQFTIEYSVLFDATLPALERLGLPIPLGGTSNHFRRETLIAVGGWDPYNVTEDADLGIRLARFGLQTATVASTTWEEAPPDFANWRTQRTRWLKGWMQTWLVHTRQPLRLWRELGVWQFIGLQIFMGGVLLSVLVYPIACLVIVLQLALIGARGSAIGWADTWIWQLAGGSLMAGLGISVLLGILAALRRGQPGLALWALAMPIYWLLISAAGYRAVFQLVRNPFLWEKTQHGKR